MCVCYAASLSRHLRERWRRGLNAKARRKLKRAQEKELEAAPKGTAAESAIIGEARKAAACLEAAEKAATTTAAAVTAAQAVANSAHAAWKTAATALVGSSTVYRVGSGNSVRYSCTSCWGLI